MRKLCIAVVVVGGVLAIPMSGAMGQDMASAPAGMKSSYLVFLEGDKQLSPMAAETVRKAADASKDARGIRVEHCANWLE